MMQVRGLYENIVGFSVIVTGYNLKLNDVYLICGIFIQLLGIYHQIRGYYKAKSNVTINTNKTEIKTTDSQNDKTN